MEEIALQFKLELQGLLDRYKNRLSVPRIMYVAQDVFHKTLSIKYHPELHSKAINYFLQSTGYTKPEHFKEINGLKVPADLLEGPDDPEFRKILQGDINA